MTAKSRRDCPSSRSYGTSAARVIAKYGCFGCHDIPGFETAKQIGPQLSDWGRKDTTLLAFENINAYLQSHDKPEAQARG